MNYAGKNTAIIGAGKRKPCANEFRICGFIDFIDALADQCPDRFIRLLAAVTQIAGNFFRIDLDHAFRTSDRFSISFPATSGLFIE